MEEPRTTGSGDLGVTNKTGKAGGGEGKGEGRPIEDMLYQSNLCLVGIVMATALTCFH